MQDKIQNISPIKQRILQFVDTLGISKREFYAKIGVSRGTLESKTGITEDIVAKFIAEYSHVSLDWLIRGEGEMLKEECPNKSCSDIVHEPHVEYQRGPIVENQNVEWMRNMLISQQRTIENLSKAIADRNSKD